LIPPRLYLDENIPVVLALALQARGFDVVTARDRGQLGRTDLQHLRVASREERAVLTFDVADFPLAAAEHLQNGEHHWGLILAVQRRSKDLGVLVGSVARFLTLVDRRELRDQTVFLRRAR
jgi:predicted nuclease of predicted toxin-antitoxin system